MKDDAYKTLNVLGCVPGLLNVLFELAHEAQRIRRFNILLNVPVEIALENAGLDEWDVAKIHVYECEDGVPENGLFAFSVVGVKSKEIVYNYFNERFGLHKSQFLNLIHPTAYVSRSADLDYGLQVEPLSLVSSRTTLGFGVTIKRGCNVGHHCCIGRFVTLNPGVTVCGYVTVGDQTMIGAGAVVRDGVKIGCHTVIGAGSVVVDDIPDHVVAFGNPCRPQKVIKIH